MFQKILVPLDGTDTTEEILPYVVRLAKAFDVPLALHTIVDSDAMEVPSSVYPAQMESNLETHAKDRLDSIARRLREEGLAVDTSTGVGKPAEEVLRAAKEQECGLIAMATHSKNVVTRAILGSVTDKVIHSADVPVLSITPEKAREYHPHGGPVMTSVIVPLDGSQLGERALPYVESIAQALSLEVVLARVVQDHPAQYPDASIRLPDIASEAERQAANYLRAVGRGIEDLGPRVRTQVLRGAPAVALSAFARENPQSIIVITTHGRSGISRWLLGSVAEALVRSSGDPVMVIPTRT